MHIQYLEIVTTDVDAVCTIYSQLHEITFGDSDPNLGGARTAKLANGGWIGVRAPLHDAEQPIVRPYTLVDDIETAVRAAADTGTEIALPPTEIAGHGKCAILIHSGIQLGLWQV